MGLRGRFFEHEPGAMVMRLAGCGNENPVGFRINDRLSQVDRDGLIALSLDQIGQYALDQFASAEIELAPHRYHHRTQSAPDYHREAAGRQARGTEEVRRTGLGASVGTSHGVGSAASGAHLCSPARAGICHSTPKPSTPLSTSPDVRNPTSLSEPIEGSAVANPGGDLGGNVAISTPLALS